MQTFVPHPDFERSARSLDAKRLGKQYEAIYLKTKVTKIEAGPDGLTAHFEGGDAPTTATFDKVLVAVGRKPNGKLVGAENAGVRVDERGYIAVDKQMRTNVGHIFAIGDLVGQPMLAHKAVHEGKVAAEVAALRASGARLVIAGGTGLYLTALTRGLAIIPPVPPEIRERGDRWLAEGGLADMIAALDGPTRALIDTRNPARVQRAWEVLAATGRGLSAWQADTPPPLIRPEDAQRLVLTMDRDRLAARIAARFDAMIHEGALQEVGAMRAVWDRRAQWTRAIGAGELKAHLDGMLSLDEARARAVIATRQYAKAQRIWFRSKMGDWTPVPV